jgi:hypothetical protein
MIDKDCEFCEWWDDDCGCCADGHTQDGCADERSQ